MKWIESGENHSDLHLQQIGNVDVPCFEDVVLWMIHDIHIDRYIRRNLDEGSEIKHPSVEVDPARHEAEKTPVFAPTSYCCPTSRKCQPIIALCER